MIRTFSVIGTIFAFSIAATVADESPRRKSPIVAIVEKSKPALLTIESVKDGKSTWAVGVVVDPKGIVLVPTDSLSDEVVAVDAAGVKHSAKVVVRDRKLEIAFLRIAAEKPLPRLQFADPTKVEIGEQVILVGGYPSRSERSVSTGIVSGRPRDFADGERRMLVDTSSSPGSPPGVVLDLEGRLLGTNARSGNILFVLPPDRIAKLLEAAPK